MAAVQPPPSLWPVGFRIRPPADLEAPAIEVVDTVTGRRFRWTPESLARYVLRDGRIESNGDSEKWWDAVQSSEDRRALIPGWRHWHERGWHPSDQYYVASRRWDYVDTRDTDGSIRTAVIERLLGSDGQPAEEVIPSGPRVALGPAESPGTQPMAELLVTRRSERAFRIEPVPRESLSGLLWFGLDDVRSRRKQTRPSAPLSYLESFGSAWDVYLCVYNVAGIEPGVYRYDLLAHELISVRPGDHRQAMVDVLQGMNSPSTAAWTLSLVADFPRYQWRYRHEHALRRLYIEAGFLGQELIILGMSYRLGTLVTPAQKDRPFLDLHRLPAERYGPVYTLTMGFARRRGGSTLQPG